MTVNAIDFLIIHRKLEIKTVYHNRIFTAASYLHLYMQVVSVSQLTELMRFLFHCIWSEWYGQVLDSGTVLGRVGAKGYAFGCSFGRVESRVCVTKKRSFTRLPVKCLREKDAFCSFIHYMPPKIFARSITTERGIFRNITVNFFNCSAKVDGRGFNY